MIFRYCLTIFKSSSFSLLASLEPKCELIYSIARVRPLMSSYVVYTFKIVSKGSIIIYQLGGGGLGSFRGVVMKKIFTKWGGGVTVSFIIPKRCHRYDFHFLFWLQNDALATEGLSPASPPPSPFFVLLMLPFLNTMNLRPLSHTLIY